MFSEYHIEDAETSLNYRKNYEMLLSGWLYNATSIVNYMNLHHENQTECSDIVFTLSRSVQQLIILPAVFNFQ